MDRRSSGLSPRSRGSQADGVGREVLPGSIPALAGKPQAGQRGKGGDGVYPRARGEASSGSEYTVPLMGLSPRSRGSRSRSRTRPPTSRSIPALAGKPRPDCQELRRLAVYPRARGEAGHTTFCMSESTGLSPRSRGSLRCDQEGDRHDGSIPALAGKPDAPCLVCPRSRVYPRARGEARGAGGAARYRGGLSPRSRGSPDWCLSPWSSRRSIPALAGKPLPKPRTSRPTWVYPRARGEAPTRGRGSGSTTGLSPRSRGSRLCRSCPGCPLRSIPALAGKPTVADQQASQAKVYPRARGEAPKARSSPSANSGLSPRSRGSRGSRRPDLDPVRSIPALAGKPASGTGSGGRAGVYPRARGEAAQWLDTLPFTMGLSPRSRGSRRFSVKFVMPGRSIPALAGKPRRRGIVWPGHEVYPRARGEAPHGEAELLGLQGLSPRSRGSLVPLVPLLLAHRSIPALAGKPRMVRLSFSVSRVYPRARGEA